MAASIQADESTGGAFCDQPLGLLSPGAGSAGRFRSEEAVEAGVNSTRGSDRGRARSVVAGMRLRGTQTSRSVLGHLPGLRAKEASCVALPASEATDRRTPPPFLPSCAALHSSSSPTGSVGRRSESGRLTCWPAGCQRHSTQGRKAGPGPWLSANCTGAIH